MFKSSLQGLHSRGGKHCERHNTPRLVPSTQFCLMFSLKTLIKLHISHLILRIFLLPILDDFVFRKFYGSKRETTPVLPVTWRATLSPIRFFSRSCVSSFLNIMIMTMTRLTMIMMMTWMESATLSPIRLFSKSFARWQGDRDS